MKSCYKLLSVKNNNLLHKENLKKQVLKQKKTLQYMQSEYIVCSKLIMSQHLRGKKRMVGYALLRANSTLHVR